MLSSYIIVIVVFIITIVVSLVPLIGRWLKYYCTYMLQLQDVDREAGDISIIKQR